MTKSLNLASLRAVGAAAPTEIDLPQGKGKIFVKAITGGQLIRLSDYGDGIGNPNHWAEIIHWGLVDEAGVPLCETVAIARELIEELPYHIVGVIVGGITETSTITVPDETFAGKSPDNRS